MRSVKTRPSIAVTGDAIEPRHKRAALTVAMLGFAVVALDAQITNVALPAIRQHLGGGLSGLQWVVTGYTFFTVSVVAFAAFLAVQARSSHPMVPLALFRSRPVAITLAMVFVGAGGALTAHFASGLRIDFTAAAGTSSATRTWQSRSTAGPARRAATWACRSPAGPRASVTAAADGSAT